MDRKQDNPLISVVIPIYNVAAYLESCLDSVVAQTYRPLEVILVDDCGTDNSMEIAETFVKNYKGKSYFEPLNSHVERVYKENTHFRILHHDYNRGLSAARNTGTDNAHGKYVYYLDSDDHLNSNCIQLLVDSAETKHAELTIGGYKNVGIDVILGGDCILSDGVIIEGNTENVEAFCQRKYYVMAWNKLVLLDFLKEHNIRFIEGILHEDSPWSLEIAYYLKRMSVVNKPIYNYLVRPDSISTNVQLIKKIRSWTIILNTFFELIEEHPEFKENKYVYEYYANEILNYFQMVVEKLPRKDAVAMMSNLSNYKYKSRWFNMSATVHKSHRILNILYYLPKILQYYVIRILLLLKKVKKYNKTFKLA